MSTSFKTVRHLALTGALALAAFAGLSPVTATDAEARGFHGRGGGRMMHGGHLGGRHAFHHRHWRHHGHHWRHHRWGWRFGAPLLAGGVVTYGDCYIARQRVWSDAYAA
ncbi:MAG: sulfur globule protein precursor [Beijerinckiaceae bacterium]